MKNSIKYVNAKPDPVFHTPYVIEWLYVGALLLHICWIFWVKSSEPIAVVTDFTRWLINSYSAIGFKWLFNDGSILIAAGLLSTVFINILRRAVEGLILGWPRFTTHDVSTLRAFILRAVGYGLLCFLGLGAYGVNMSEKFVKLTSLVGHPVNITVFDIAIISFITFLLGSVDVLPLR